MIEQVIDQVQDLVLKLLDKLQDILGQIIILVMIPNPLKTISLLMLEILPVTPLISKKLLNKFKKVQQNY